MLCYAVHEDKDTWVPIGNSRYHPRSGGCVDSIASFSECLLALGGVLDALPDVTMEDWKRTFKAIEVWREDSSRPAGILQR